MCTRITFITKTNVKATNQASIIVFKDCASKIHRHYTHTHKHTPYVVARYVAHSCACKRAHSFLSAAQADRKYLCDADVEVADSPLLLIPCWWSEIAQQLFHKCFTSSHLRVCDVMCFSLLHSLLLVAVVFALFYVIYFYCNCCCSARNFP